MSIMRFTKINEQKNMQKYFFQYFRKSNIRHSIASFLCILFSVSIIIFFDYLVKTEPPTSSKDTVAIILSLIIMAIPVIIWIIHFILSVKRLICGNFFEKYFQNYLKEHPEETMKNLSKDFHYGVKVKNTESLGSRSWICPKHIFYVHRNIIRIYSIYEMKNLKWYKKTIRKRQYHYDAFFISFVDKNNKKQEISFSCSDCIDIVDTIKYNIEKQKEYEKIFIAR